MQVQRKGYVLKVRYLIKFSKENSIKFISHLDLMRTIQRMIKRSGLPVAYSQGFNPHMVLSIAQPLSVGMYSEGEYMDVVFNKEILENLIVEKLNESSPLGIKVKKAIKIIDEMNKKKTPQAMALIDIADYCLTIKYHNIEKLQEQIDNLVKLKEWKYVRKNKKGEKEINLRPLIKKINYEVKQDTLIINMRAACGSRENLSVQHLSQYIKENTTDANMEAFTDIFRKDMYTLRGKKLIPLSDINTSSK